MSTANAIVGVISRNGECGRVLASQLQDLGIASSVVVSSTNDFKDAQAQHIFTLVLVDRAMPEDELKHLFHASNRCPIATFGTSGTSSAELKAIESSASYQLRHPAATIDLERMFSYVDRHAPTASGSPTNRSAHLYRGLVGDSNAVIQLRELIEKIASSKSTVLISGETGTGKEIVARNIHYYSDQSSGPFVPVNCSAIPPDLLESELFGHKKGAFTGALTDRVGRFEMAAGGTLFLDEIGDMTPGLQAKLLRVLEERIIQRVGCNKSIKMTARLVAATHRNLEQRIEDGNFREDLFYRLNVVPVEVPSLRQRKEDIPQLSVELSRRLQREQDMSIELTADALRQLRKHDWPGNVRELANLVERLAVICPNGIADVSDLPTQYQLTSEVEGPGVATGNQENAILSHTLTAQHWPEEGIDLKSYLRSTEATLIQQALEHSGGTMSHAAELLHVRRTTLVEKVKRLGLNEHTVHVK